MSGGGGLTRRCASAAARNKADVQDDDKWRGIAPFPHRPALKAELIKRPGSSRGSGAYGFPRLGRRRLSVAIKSADGGAREATVGAI